MVNNPIDSGYFARFPGACITGLAFMVLSFGQAVAAGRHDLKQEFLKEYAPASRRLEQFYTRIQMSELQVRGDTKLTYFFRSNGDSYRVEKLDSDGEIVAATVNTPRWRFQVAKNEQTGAYYYSKANSETYGSHVDRTRVIGTKLPYASYCIRFDRVVDFLASSDCKVLSVTHLERDGKELVQVSYEQFFRKSRARVPGWLLFSPRDAWALVEYHYGRQHDRCRVEYGDAVDGIPLVKQADYWREPDKGERKAINHSELLNVVFEPAHAENLEPGSFGLPNIFKPPATSWPWRLPLAFIGLAGAAFLSYLARRLPTPRRILSDART